MATMTQDQVDALVTVHWPYVLGGFWPGARVIDTGESGTRGWVGTVVRKMPDKEGFPQSGLDVCWEVPDGKDSYMVTSVVGGSALLLDEAFAFEGLAGNVAELGHRIAHAVGYPSSPIRPATLSRHDLQELSDGKYWRFGDFGGYLPIHDLPDLRWRTTYPAVRVPGISDIVQTGKALRHLSMHFAEVPPNLQHLVR